MVDVLTPVPVSQRRKANPVPVTPVVEQDWSLEGADELRVKINLTFTA